MSQFQANLKKMPGISHLEALNLIDADGNIGEGSRAHLQKWMNRYVAWVSKLAS